MRIVGREARRQRVAPAKDLGDRVRRWSTAAAAAGAVAAVLAAASGGVSWGLVVPAAALGAAVAVAAAVAVRVARILRHGRWRVVPTAYDILVGAGADEAERRLARWWDDSLRGAPRTATGARVLA